MIDRTKVFTKLLEVRMPEKLTTDEAGRTPPFEIEFVANGHIPFPQIVFRSGASEKVLNGEHIRRERTTAGRVTYVARIPAGILGAGRAVVQIEGCRQDDISRAGDSDWVKRAEALPIEKPSDTCEELVCTTSTGSAEEQMQADNGGPDHNNEGPQKAGAGTPENQSDGQSGHNPTDTAASSSNEDIIVQLMSQLRRQTRLNRKADPEYSERVANLAPKPPPDASNRQKYKHRVPAWAVSKSKQ